MSTRDSSYTGSNRILRGQRRGCLLATVAVGLATLAAGQAAHAADVTITVDAGKQVSGNPHFWSTCVGTGTASLTLRPDLQTHYKIGNRELGFLRIRGHGVLNDDMGIYKGAGSYDWSKFDTYLAAITAAKMVPLMELSFMPKSLAASGNDRNPPKDYDAYQKFIQAVVQHTVEKLGADEVSKWYWEVWNEPNYEGFWTGTMDDYLKLYDAAVAGATAALPNILIGGPVTTPGSTSQMTTFINHVKSKNVRFNFLSSHAYPGGEQPDADANFALTDNDGRVKVITTAGYTTDEILSFNTEWNSSYSGQGGKTAANVVSMDNHVNAPFILKTVKLLADKTVGDKPVLPIFSYWSISDVFDEYSGPSGSYILSQTEKGTLPFGSVFGLMTFQGMRKAAFNGFKMLNYLGDNRLQVSGGTGSKDGVDGMAAISADGGQVQIIVYNYYATIAQTGSDNVTVTVNNLPFAGKEAYIARFAIDETHTNPYSVWVGQNKPKDPTEAQWQAMRKVQHLMPVEDITKKTLEGSYTATFAVPKQGAAMIILSLKRPLTGRDAKVEIEGEDYDGQSGITKEESGDSSMGQSVAAAANSWMYFENVDYSDEGVDSVDLRVKAAADTSVELRSESETGTVLGKCALSAATSWATQTCKLSAPATGVSKLYLLFAGSAHLNWLKFSSGGGTPTGGSGGNSGTGGSGGNSGTASTGAGGKGGSSAGTSTGGGAGGNGGAKSSGTTSSGGSSGGASSSSSKASGGSAGKSSSSGGASSSGGSSSSRSSDSSGGSSGQSSSRGSSSSASNDSSSGCGCRVGGTGRGSQGIFSLFGLLFGVLAMRRRREWVRASRACIALLAAACGSNSESGAGGQGGSTSSAGQSGSSAKSNLVSSGGAGGTSSAAGGSSSKASSGLGGKTESGGSSAAGGSKGGVTATTGCAGCDHTTGGTGGKPGTAGNGGTGTGTGGTSATSGSGGTASGSGGTTSGTAGQGGTTGTGTGGTTSNPPPTLSLVTTKQGAEWTTDGPLKEVTSGSADITVNDGSPLQDWEGFGAAFNEMGWNVLTMLSDADKSKALNLLFAADGANFAWGRIPMGATDYAMDRYTCNETADDTSMSKFSIKRDQDKLIPFIKAAKEIKTDMRFWASPWTPPTWLKSGPFNDDFPYDGGKMKTDATSLQALADYFVSFVKAYAEQGIKIEIVSPQNEPGYSGTYPTCGWDPTAYATFVGKYLGPAVEKLSVKVMLGTFNGGTGDTDIVSTVMGDATAKGYIKLMGFQWGMDGSIASAKQYGVPIWQSEHKCGNYPWETYNKDKAPNDQAYAVESWGLIRDWIKKGVTAYSTWNVVLDTIGVGIDATRVWPQNALLTVDTSAKKLIITPTYYVFRHFSQFVQPGAKVVGTTGGDAVAFKNSDGSIVTVLYNKDAAEKTMTVAAGSKKLQFAVPGTGWATVIAR